MKTKLSLSAEGQRLTGLNNDLSMISYESVFYFYPNPLTWILKKKDACKSTKIGHYAFALLNLDMGAFFSSRNTTAIKLIYLTLISFYSLCAL